MKQTPMKTITALLTAIFLFGCSDAPPTDRRVDTAAFTNLALAFTQALADRDYAAAHAMTTTGFQASVSQAQLRTDFEYIVPTDWKTVGPIGVGHHMVDWPDKQPAEVAWVYVHIGGDEYSEAVTLIIANDGGALKVRDIEYGRP